MQEYFGAYWNVERTTVHSEANLGMCFLTLIDIGDNFALDREGSQEVLKHTCHLGSWHAGGGVSLVMGKPGLHSEFLSKAPPTSTS